VKHLATIQSEFLKQARDWDELSEDEQRRYLKEHPKSKRRLTAKPRQKTTAPQEKITSMDQFRAAVKNMGLDMTKYPYNTISAGNNILATIAEWLDTDRIVVNIGGGQSTTTFNKLLSFLSANAPKDQLKQEQKQESEDDDKKAIKNLLDNAEIDTMMDFYSNEAKYDMDFTGDTECYVNVISNNLRSHFSEDEIKIIEKDKDYFRELLTKHIDASLLSDDGEPVRSYPEDDPRELR